MPFPDEEERFVLGVDEDLLVVDHDHYGILVDVHHKVDPPTKLLFESLLQDLL